MDRIVKRLRENRILNERADYSKKSVKELVELAQGGDRLAVDTLIKSYDGFINMMGSKFILDSGDADDVKQIATIAFWDAILKWDGEGDFDAYAGMIIKRKLTDELRKDSTEKAKTNTYAAHMEDTGPDDGEGGAMTVGDTIASNVANPFDELAAKEIKEFLKNNLSDAEQECIWLKVKGYKTSEIAEETGMKYKTVENALKRVKDKLAEYLRARESKKIDEDDSIDFSDEEKSILRYALNQINEEKKLQEAEASQKYASYTKEQFDEILADYEKEANEIYKEIKSTDYDQRDSLLARLETMTKELDDMEEYLTDEQYYISEDIQSIIFRAEEAEYDYSDEKYQSHKWRDFKDY